MENTMTKIDTHRCDHSEGLQDAFYAINEAYIKSRNIEDLGMYRDGTGSEDPTERAYHNGLLAALNVVDKLLKDIDA